MDEQQYKEVEELAALQYSPQEVGMMLGLTDEQVADEMSNREGQFFTRYIKGFYTTDIQLRNAVKKLALAGSGPAQAMLLRMIEKSEMKTFYERA